MRQLPQDAIKTQETIDENTDSTKWTSFCVMALTGLFNVGLQGMMSMVEALQLMVFLPILKVSMPANAAKVFDALTQIAAFDIIEIGDYVESILKLLPTDPVNEKYESIGLESLYFINNLGSFTFVLLVYFTMIAAWLLLGISFVLNIQQAKKLQTKLGRKIFWNKGIGLVKESYLVVVICASISLSYNFVFSDTGKQVQIWSTLIILSFYIILPIFVLIKVACYFS